MANHEQHPTVPNLGHMNHDALRKMTIADLGVIVGPFPWALDISVAAESPQLPVESMTFSVTVRPNPLDIILRRPPYKLSIQTLLYDDFGNSVAIPPLEMWSNGGTITRTVDVPIADRSKLGFPDPERLITVWIDPFDMIRERSETNNKATARCYSIG